MGHVKMTVKMPCVVLSTNDPNVRLRGVERHSLGRWACLYKREKENQNATGNRS